MLHLMKNEKVIWQSFPGTNYRLFVLVRDLTLGMVSAALMCFFMLIMEAGSGILLFGASGGIFLLWAMLAVRNQISLILIKYTLTNERIIIKKGFLNRNMVSIKHEKITDTEVKQTFNEQIINVGTIYLYTANDVQASENSNTPKIENIDYPFELHTKITEALQFANEEDSSNAHSE